MTRTSRATRRVSFTTALAGLALLLLGKGPVALDEGACLLAEGVGLDG